MQWWEALDPDVQKYAAGGVVTGTIALIGTIVTFILSGIRDTRRENARRAADRTAEDDRRKADREAEDRRRQAELEDRQDFRAHEHAQQVQALSREALRECLAIAVEVLAAWDGSVGTRGLTADTSITRQLQRLRTSALTVQDVDVRRSMREGVSALFGVESREMMGLERISSVWSEERRIIEAMVNLLAAAIRDDQAEQDGHAYLLAEAKKDAQEAEDMRYGAV